MTLNEAEASAERKQPTFICEFCGPDKPAKQVFQCTVCLKHFCVAHIGPSTHDCYTNE